MSKMATEKRLIDANALKANFSILGEFAKDLWHAATILSVIDNAPTVEAVEVVRCKDCKHYVLQACACRNDNFNGIIHMNGFCSYGERKNNER